MSSNAAPLVAVQATIDETDNLADEISAALEASNPVNEQRYNQLLEELRECRNRLENLSTLTASENPMLVQVLSEVARVQESLTALSAKVESLSEEQRTQREAIQSSLPPVPPLDPGEQRTGELTAEPVPLEAVEITEIQAPPAPRRRVRLL